MLRENSFIRHVITLITGTSLAQLLPIVAMPILARIYDPSDLGILANYLAITLILSTVFTLRLDMAIVIIQKNEHAIRLVTFCISVAFFLSIIVFFFILVGQIVLYNNKGIIHYWWFFIPIGAFFTACYTVVLSWLNRSEKYYDMSISRVIQSSVITIFQIFACLFPISGLNLVIADLFARMISTNIIILKKINIKLFSLHGISKKQYALVHKYKHFPCYELPASLLNTFSQQLPFIFMPFTFGDALTGIYFLVYRVMLLPVSLISSAVAEVFRIRAINILQESNDCRGLFFKTATSLLVMAVFPFFLVIAFAPWGFSTIFGSEWGKAGEYAQILAPSVLLRFISSPLSTILIIREKKINVFLQGVFLCLISLSLFLGYYFNDIKILVVLLSISGCVFYLFQMIASYFYAHLKN